MAYIDWGNCVYRLNNYIFKAKTVEIEASVYFFSIKIVTILYSVNE